MFRGSGGLTYETRAILAGAYRGGERETLTHTVKLGLTVAPVPLCGVKPSSIADAHADDPSAPPTCPTCARRDPRFNTLRKNPQFDGSKRQAFQQIKATVVKAGAHNLRIGTKVIVLHIDEARGIAMCSVSGATAHVPVDCLEVTGGAFMQHMFASNPPLVVFGNPPGKKSRGSKMLSKRAISIRYVHAADGQRYEHKFGANDCIELLADGSFRIYNKSGKNLWKDFL